MLEDDAEGKRPDAETLSRGTSSKAFYIDCNSFTTGTHKDFRSARIIDKAEKEGVKNIHLITAGNAGISLKQEIERRETVIYDKKVDKDVPSFSVLEQDKK